MGKPRYFPVTTTPLAMRAGLHPFGADFGNGFVDRQFLQRDHEFPRYIAAKRACPSGVGRLLVVDDTPVRHAVHVSALDFLRRKLREEHGASDTILDDDDAGIRERYQAATLLMQEDFAVLHRGVDDVGDAVALSVTFPSGWRPERLVGADFQSIHGPVPAFVDKKAAAQSMVRAMVDRGPYVRFVWTVSADDELDHHPDEGRRAPWTDALQGFLRVERQTTVPFPEVDGSVFLIRTFLYPFTGLTPQERATLREAVSVMPDDIARYKGLLEGKERILALLHD